MNVICSNLDYRVDVSFLFSLFVVCIYLPYIGDTQSRVLLCCHDLCRCKSCGCFGYHLRLQCVLRSFHRWWPFAYSGQLSSFLALLARSMVCCLGFPSLLYADMFLIDSDMLRMQTISSLAFFCVALSPSTYPISNINKDIPHISQ